MSRKNRTSSSLPRFLDVNKAALVKRMNDICARENIDGVLDIRDETDCEGLRIVVDIRKDVNPEDIRNFFIKKTDLQVVQLQHGRYRQQTADVDGA